MRKITVLLMVLTLAGSGFAELKLARIFSDGMVLQCGQAVPVWGWADPGTEVTVGFAGMQEQTTADAKGKFMVHLDPMEVMAEPQVLTLKAGDESFAIKNVLVGEVWLCSGQSNMQWPVERSQHFEQVREEADFPLIRMFMTDLTTALEPQTDVAGAWRVCSPGNVGAFSATGYFFGLELFKELGVPVGLIRSAWGGTRIEAWSPMPSLKPFPSVMQYKADRDKWAEQFDEAAEEERFEKALAEWKEKAAEARGAGKQAPRRPRKKSNPRTNQNYPANLYNAMIHPLVPYSIKGAIWYQGEANAHSTQEAILYRDLLANMVTAWRQDWNMDFPFYAVQLVNFRKPPSGPVEDSGWAFIRESFVHFDQNVPHTGMAVGIDVGEAGNIHPKNKQAIGKRLAQQALVKTYGRNGVPGGPVYQSMEKQDNRIVLQFDQVGSGLTAKDGSLKWFAVAGEDRDFVEADAEIIGDTVVVQAESVPDPVAVRYAWADNPAGCNLYNKEGYPASPFRTDDWPPAGK